MRIVHLALLVIAVIIAFYGLFCVKHNNNAIVMTGISFMALAGMIRMVFLRKQI